MIPAQILKDELKGDKQKFALAMNRANVRYEMGPRESLKEMTKGLIELDREQTQATAAFELDKIIAYKRFKALSKPKPLQSAWFGGEYDERTYY